ncbi:WD40 repeat-like protein [Nadsonia fulvescens var. elongata DSM 6958]|uniref:WD40 repeat-like protein n=1 Tax=Nadsonia fulvescens var. elongata DSM 6958 TaxID=857566 RepID=A0A1E3PSA8_9ASCO|nr:WD40 repeat-like protein [Nadsonia fulvescens var. elongata DSM 6958]
MFLMLPPSPSYNQQRAWGQAPVNQIEMTSSLDIPDEEKLANDSLHLPEGTCVPIQRIHIPKPPHHPSDPLLPHSQQILINPLAPNIKEPSRFSRGSMISVFKVDKDDANSGIKSPPSPSLPSELSGKANNANIDTLPALTTTTTHASTNSSLFGFRSKNQTRRLSVVSSDSGAVSDDGLRPINSHISGPTGTTVAPGRSLVKTYSSFITRSVVLDEVKKIQNRPSNDVYAFMNSGRSLSWMDMMPATSSSIRYEPLTKVLFKGSYPLCHDFNLVTKTNGYMEVIAGFSSGDIVWIDLVSSKYTRINKNGEINSNPVVDIRWVPGSVSRFVAAHADGSVLMYEKDREDASFVPTATNPVDASIKGREHIKIWRSHYSKSNIKQNPVAWYKFSDKPLTAIEFIPSQGDDDDELTLAITGYDTYLRLFSLTTETISDMFPSYFGKFLCLGASPDGVLLAAGGEDDLVSIFRISAKDTNNSNGCGGNIKPLLNPASTLIARGKFHSSWVRQVRFDPWNSTAKKYRLGSVSEGGEMALWDISPKALAKTSLVKSNTAATMMDGTRRHRRSSSNGSSMFAFKPSLQGDTNVITTDFNRNTELPAAALQKTHPTVIHTSPSRMEIPFIRPFFEKVLRKKEGEDPDRLSDIAFLSNNIIVSSFEGRVWSWRRQI